MTESICRRPLRNRTKAVSIPGIVGISLALPAFILRLLARMMSSQFGMDDWAMIVAMVRILTIEVIRSVGLHGVGIRDPALCDGCYQYVKGCLGRSMFTDLLSSCGSWIGEGYLVYSVWQHHIYPPCELMTKLLYIILTLYRYITSMNCSTSVV
jgi:hypothetical protein